MKEILFSIGVIVAGLLGLGFLCYSIAQSAFSLQVKGGWTPMLQPGEQVDDRRPKLWFCMVAWPILLPISCFWLAVTVIANWFSGSKQDG